MEWPPSSVRIDEIKILGCHWIYPGVSWRHFDDRFVRPPKQDAFYGAKEARIVAIRA
jgi:hypothetical protein